jgi:hypothetical protein
MRVRVKKDLVVGTYYGNRRFEKSMKRLRGKTFTVIGRGYSGTINLDVPARMVTRRNSNNTSFSVEMLEVL